MMLGAGKKTILVLAILMVCAMKGVAVALRSFGTIQIGYNVVPPAQPPTLTVLV